MSRPRTAWPELPSRLHWIRGAFLYYRPDIQRKVRLPVANQQEAIAVANELNNAFGFEHFRAGASARYRSRFIEHDWSQVGAKTINVLSLCFPDLSTFAAPGNAAALAWSQTEAPARLRISSGLSLSFEVDDPPLWLRILWRVARKNAAARRMRFELALQDAAALVKRSQGRCEVSGIDLSMTVVRGLHRLQRPWAPSIDRINSALGYTRENCRIVCVAANIAMHQWGEDVLIELAKGIARKRLERRANGANRVSFGVAPSTPNPPQTNVLK